VKVGAAGSGLVKFLATPGLVGKHRAAQVTAVAADVDGIDAGAGVGERQRKKRG